MGDGEDGQRDDARLLARDGYATGWASGTAFGVSGCSCSASRSGDMSSVRKKERKASGTRMPERTSDFWLVLVLLKDMVGVGGWVRWWVCGGIGCRGNGRWVWERVG